VLVSHDGAEWLPEVIASLFAQSRQVDRIVAVDNGSIDGSNKLISNAGITLLKSDRESGFGDAIDLALDSTKAIPEDKEELLWLLHDDCALNRHTLARLVESFNDEPMLAMVGPKLRGWRDRNKLLEVGISIAVNGARWTGLEDSELDQGQHDDPKEVLAVSTAAALIRRKVFEDLGGLDPNLAIFRDDVDLGWRLRLAGYSVKTAPKAIAFHAEAAANERRSVDVEEAFLHRPHLLDRRNAAFVVLANVSWWLIPWVTIQLIGTAAIRSIGYLLAKLPGYAADEIAAVGLLIIKPNDLRKARKVRKPKRLLSPRIIREFIPPPGSQIRLAWERSINAISKRWRSNKHEDENEPMSYADIGVLDENFDEQIQETVSFRSRIASLRNRPFLYGISALFILNLFASRNRIGSLSGGAMPIAHSGAADLLKKFGESWHPVAMGSASPTPTWVEIVGLASGATLGNVSFFISAFYFLAPLIAFIAMYRVLKRSDFSIIVATIGSLIYVMSPVVWSSINQGRLGTLVLAIFVPSFLSLKPFEISATSNWRRIYFITLLAGFIGAFSPLLLFIWTLTFIAQLGIDLFSRREEIKSKKPLTFLMSAKLDVEKRKLALGLIPLALNFPWSASLILHPTQILLEPGLLYSGGTSISTLLFNPGGQSGSPLWILSPMLLFLLVAIFSAKYVKEGVICAGLLALAILIAPLNLTGHGSHGQFWTGSILVVIQSLIIPIALRVGVDVLPNLKISKLGIGHFVSACISLVSIFSIVAMTGWATTSGANSALRSGTPNVIPAFISSLSETPAKPKTLVIKRNVLGTTYFITRGLDLELGDPDVTVGTPREIEVAVDQMILGTGIKSSKVLGSYGIQYVYMRNPIDQGLVRTIDGLGGFVRSSATSSGIVWKVFGSLPRLSLRDTAGQNNLIQATDIGAKDLVAYPGIITLAEKYDGNWKLIQNGKQIELKKSSIGEPIFEITEPGTIYLEHDGTKRRALLSLQIIIVLSVIVLALPAGRRRKEMGER
jgi:GT2 family glycosyltransferase